MSLFKCEACGDSLSSQTELAAHAVVHAKAEQQYRCEACGASFKSRAELAEHGQQKHPMARA